MITQLALAAITAYQQYVSPHKGFACAYRVVYGGCGCSGVGRRLIQRYGMFSGCVLLRKRLARCRFAAHEIRQTWQRRSGFAAAQRGDCVAVDCCVPDVDVGDCGHLARKFQLAEKCGIALDIGQCGCDCANIFGNQSEPPKKKKRQSNDVNDPDITIY